MGTTLSGVPAGTRNTRAALGLPEGEALPAQLGTVGGSRGGHGNDRINQATTGRLPLWRIEARTAATRYRTEET